MNDRRPLIDTIRDRPDDDGPRLVYADWLEERGECERAAFIRVQCDMARLMVRREEWLIGSYMLVSVVDGQAWWVPEWDMGRYRSLETRERELFEQSPETQRWLGAVFELVRAGDDWWALLKWFRRGFVHAVTCSWADWSTNVDAILAEHPVREVTLTTWPEARRTLVRVAYTEPRPLEARMFDLSEIPTLVPIHYRDEYRWEFSDTKLASVSGGSCDAVNPRSFVPELLAENWKGITFTLPSPAMERERWRESRQAEAWTATRRAETWAATHQWSPPGPIGIDSHIL